MSSGKVKCTCGWSWNKSDSSKKDMYICHECGRDNSNNMKNGGWLDSYADGGTMQEHQENYNNSEVSLPEGFVGMGNNTKGRNYSPAWGGQFQMGGNIYPVNYVPQAQEGKELTFLQPTSDKLPEGYVIPYNTPSSERAMSIGGENGEPAYLIPSFKYGKPLYDPIGEFRKTKEHLGGPFKTYQEADEWERTVRHPAVERKETIMFPQEKFAMGGSIPGAVGFSYARVGAPSKGPRRNQTDVTDASAQNGKEMKYYQEGLDFKPKSISKNGGWLSKYDVAQAGAQVQYGTPEYEEAYNKGEVVTDEGGRSPILLDEVIVNKKSPAPGFWKQSRDRYLEEHQDDGILGAIGSVATYPLGIAQQAMMYGLTGKVQTPTEGMGIRKGMEGLPGTILNTVVDPVNLIGAGILTKEEALAKLSNLKNINSEGKIFNGVNKELNNIVTKNIENYMSKRVGSDAPLPKELEPYISRVGEPSISREEEVFRNVMGHEYRDAKELENTIHLDSNGNIISNPDIKKPNLIKKDLSEGNNIKYEYFDKSGNKVSTFSGKRGPEGIHVNSVNVEPKFRRKGIASDIYKNITKDLQSKNEGTLLSRSTQHQFTDVDELGRSIAPANKLWENLVNKGEAEKFIEGMSHSYRMKPLENGGIIKDDMGYWNPDNWDSPVEIGSNEITMKHVPFDVLGISDEGDIKHMKPGKNYKYKGKKVTEFRMAKNGIRQEQKGLVNLDQLTNFTNYNTKQPGGWLDTL